MVKAPQSLGGTPRKLAFVGCSWKEEDMKALTGMMDRGELKVPVDSQYASDRSGVMAAYEKQMSNRVSAEACKGSTDGWM